MYNLQFIGSGAMGTIDNFQSNMLFWRDGEEESRLLVDCGSDVRRSLHAVGVPAKDVKAVYCSHLHDDHANGLQWLGLETKFNPACHSPDLYISRNLASPVWNNVLSGGMGTLQGEVADLDTFYRVHRIKPNGHFQFSGVKFSLVQTIHVYDGYSMQFSFGLLFAIGGKTIFITTDTQFAPEQLMDFYDKADEIFQDCETTKSPSRVHAHFNQLSTLPDETKGKMYLYHYHDGPRPDASSAGFLGFVEKGQTFRYGES